ncbi:MAG TPA: hypothetical protein VNF04_13055 [Stellaceae bacterium]|nr:hypothetical protein [Stellaceae bacterium]
MNAARRRPQRSGQAGDAARSRQKRKPSDRAPARQAKPIEQQFPSAWPNAPEDLQGIARTLSRGLR